MATAAEKKAEKELKDLETVKAALTEAGIEIPEEATIEELKALLPKGSKKSNATEAHVSWNEGVRTYSKAEHGEDFVALAESFASKKNGKVRLA